MKDHSITKADIWAYVSKTADSETKKRVEDWKVSAFFDQDLYTEILNIYAQTQSVEHTDSKVVKQKLFDTIGASNTKSIHYKSILKYAAAILILLMFYISDFQQFSSKNVIYETAFTEEKAFNLNDGSTAWLNSASEIAFNKNAPRTLQLSGEAFFEVTKDSIHPFTVETEDKLLVKALGTSFNVKSNSNDLFIEVTLLTGKVEVTSASYFNDKIIMYPNDKIQINKETKAIVKTTVNNRNEVLAWQKGVLKYKNTSFKDIARDFKNQMDITIVFEDDSIADSKFTASFKKSTAIENILDVLNISKPFNYEFKKEKNEWIVKK